MILKKICCFEEIYTIGYRKRQGKTLLDSDLLLDRVKADLGVEYLSGTPSARVIENSNLFTLSVTSRDPQAAYDILQALIKNYPAVAEYVIGKTQLNMIDYPELPTTPYNSTRHLKLTAIGGFSGFALGLGIVLLYTLLRNTVRKEKDITEKLLEEQNDVFADIINKVYNYEEISSSFIN